VDGSKSIFKSILKELFDSLFNLLINQPLDNNTVDTENCGKRHRSAIIYGFLDTEFRKANPIINVEKIYIKIVISAAILGLEKNVEKQYVWCSAANIYKMKIRINSQGLISAVS